MPAPRLRIGVVGAGPVTSRYHLAAIRGVPEVAPEFIVDLDEEKARNFALRNGFPHFASSHTELYGAVDIAIVALPNHLHAPISIALLSNGIHVLCEKPMARNPGECKAMIEAGRQSGALLAIGHNRRFRNHLQLAKKYLDEGLIGAISKIEAEEGSASDWQRSSAYFDPQLSGGGALMDVGIHAVDLIRWMAGDFAEVNLRSDATASRVENEAEMSFRLANGASGRIVSSRTRELHQRLLFTGTDGFIEAGLWGDSLRLRKNNGKAFRYFSHLEAYASHRPPADSSFVDQLFNLVQAIRGEREIIVDGHAGMNAVDAVCRAYAGRPPEPTPC